jgi:hypothetical protein
VYPSLAGSNYLSMAPPQLTTPRHLLLQHGSLPRGKVSSVGVLNVVVVFSLKYKEISQSEELTRGPPELVQFIGGVHMF